MINDIANNAGGLTPRKRTLTPKVADYLSGRKAGLPVWVRCPTVGPEFYTGQTRAKLYELAGKGLIKSASLREPGQVKGVRVFNLKSILDYIESNVMPTEQEVA